MALSNKQIIENVNETFAKGDVEGFLTYCGDDISFAMVGGEAVRGKDAIRKWMSAGPGEPPHFTVDTVVAEGDYVTCIGKMTMNENGTVVPYSYCDVWRLENGKVVDLRAFVVKTAEVAAQTA